MEGRIPAREFWKEVGQRLGLDDKDCSAFKRDFFAEFKPDENMLELVRDLKSKGIKIGLLSNTMDDAESAFEWLNLAWCLNCFDAVVLSHREGVAKPDPHIYRLACRRLGVLPPEAIHIDDLYRNIEGAIAAGLKGWHYHRNEFDKLVQFLIQHQEG
jgi:putative hydrolase of the HAD superfamily